MKNKKLELEALMQSVGVTFLNNNELKNLQGGSFHTPPIKHTGPEADIHIHPDDVAV